MCLEEEISSHYEDGLLSQNSPEEFGELIAEVAEAIYSMSSLTF